MEHTSPDRPGLGGTNLVYYHLYPGVVIVLFYILAAPVAMAAGWPSLLALLIAEVLILAPLELAHLWRGQVGSLVQRFNQVTLFREPVKPMRYVVYVLLGFVACAILYIPAFPLGLWLRSEWFNWLPDWFGQAGGNGLPMQVMTLTFGIAIVTDGLVAPLVEELYFRGYLLPRMQHLGKLAPIVNALLFTLYHFWQPHNYPGIFMVSLVLSYATWWTRNVWVSVGIHSLVNVFGAVTGMLASAAGRLPY